MKPCESAVPDRNYYQYGRECILSRVSGLVSSLLRSFTLLLTLYLSAMHSLNSSAWQHSPLLILSVSNSAVSIALPVLLLFLFLAHFHLQIPVTDLECIMRRRVSVGNLCNHNRFLLRECNVTDRVDIECNFAALGD